MRRSTSRIASRYSSSLVRSPAAERALQARDLLDHRVEHAALLPDAAPAAPSDRCCRCRRTAARTPTRGLFSVGSGVFGAAPGDRVGVGAGEAGVAGARRLAGLDRQLERRQLRVLARLLREDLIHRDAGIEPGLARRRRHVGEEPRAGLRVRAARPSGRRHALQPAQHEHLLAERRQRAQRRRELERRALGRRRSSSP